MTPPATKNRQRQARGPLRGEATERMPAFYLIPNSTSLSLGTPPAVKARKKSCFSLYKNKARAGSGMGACATHKHTHRNTSGIFPTLFHKEANSSIRNSDSGRSHE